MRSYMVITFQYTNSHFGIHDLEYGVRVPSYSQLKQSYEMYVLSAQMASDPTIQIPIEFVDL